MPYFGLSNAVAMLRVPIANLGFNFTKLHSSATFKAKFIRGRFPFFFSFYFYPCPPFSFFWFFPCFGVESWLSLAENFFFEILRCCS